MRSEILLWWLVRWGNGVLGVVVVVILQLFPITVRDILIVCGLVKLLWLLGLHSGPLPLCIGIGVIGSLMEVVPRLTALWVVIVVVWLIRWNGGGIERLVRWVGLEVVVLSLLRWK